jgi:hypothetical protein
MNEKPKDTSPMIRSWRIERSISIEERNDPPMPNSFDVKVVYASTALPEWFQGLQSIVEDETFTSMIITLGNGRVRYHISIADSKVSEQEKARAVRDELARQLRNERGTDEQ